jgi:NAD(P)-dependent dehydrogenase (short-subunit alcohol dehydrogenase family)
MTGGYLSALRLDGRGVVVLGVGPGIGGAVCDAVAEAGGSLLCVDLDPAAAERTAARCGGKAMAGDVTDRDALTAVFDRAEELFGGAFYGVVDVVGVTRPGLLAEETEETMTLQFDLVLRHVLLLTQIAHPRLARSGRGAWFSSARSPARRAPADLGSTVRRRRPSTTSRAPQPWSSARPVYGPT